MSTRIELKCELDIEDILSVRVVDLGGRYGKGLDVVHRNCLGVAANLFFGLDQCRVLRDFLNEQLKGE